METVSLNIAATDYGKYVLDENAKFFISFDSIPLIDEISGQSLQISGESLSTLVSGPHGQALKVQPRSKFNLSLLLNTTTEFSLGFWLNPSYIPPNVSNVTGLPVYYRMALFDKSNFSYSSSTGYTSADSGSFVVYEECREDGFNVLKILLIGSDLRETNLETERYETGKFHHFWITYYGPSRKLQVFIDGKSVALFSEDGYQIPTSIYDNPVIPFSINNSAVGYSSVLRNNNGTLDEVVFFNKFIIDIDKIATLINFGARYIIDESFSYRSYTHNCFAFDDPTSLGVTSVLSNGKNFYAGRNDGVIFKGDRVMWQSRRDFANADEVKFIKKNILDAEAIINVEDGALKIYKGSVRI
jgi:hypothetical protein